MSPILRVSAIVSDFAEMFEPALGYILMTSLKHSHLKNLRHSQILRFAQSG